MTRDIFGYPGGNGSPRVEVKRPLPTMTAGHSILEVAREAGQGAAVAGVSRPSLAGCFFWLSTQRRMIW